MAYFMEKACKHCPFRIDVKPFLHPERGEGLAVHACNPYNSFPCHKTTVSNEDSENGEMMTTENSKECAGFITLQINEGMECPEGFTPSENIYEDAYAMIDAYAEQDN